MISWSTCEKYWGDALPLMLAEVDTKGFRIRWINCSQKSFLTDTRIAMLPSLLIKAGEMFFAPGITSVNGFSANSIRSYASSGTSLT